MKNVYEYLMVVNPKTGRKGYIEIDWHEQRSPDELIKACGLDVKETYYWYVSEEPEGVERITELEGMR